MMSKRAKRKRAVRRDMKNPTWVCVYHDYQEYVLVHEFDCPFDSANFMIDGYGWVSDAESERRFVLVRSDAEDHAPVETTPGWYIADPQPEPVGQIQHGPLTFASPTEACDVLVERINTHGFNSFEFSFPDERPVPNPSFPPATWPTTQEYVAAGEEEALSIDWDHLRSCLYQNRRAVRTGLFDKLVFDYFDHYHPGFADYLISYEQCPEIECIIRIFCHTVWEILRVEVEERVLQDFIVDGHAAVEKFDETLRLFVRAGGTFQSADPLMVAIVKMRDLDGELQVAQEKWEKIEQVPLGSYIGLCGETGWHDWRSAVDFLRTHVSW